jgi:hypothetical protein
MAESFQPAVVCPECARRHRWSAAFAGRRVACPCGKIFRMPAGAAAGRGGRARPRAAAAPQQNDSDRDLPILEADDSAEEASDAYDVAVEPQPVRERKAPVTPLLAVGDVPPPRTATERALAERADEVRVSPFVEYMLPWLLTAVGIAFTLSVWGLFFSRSFAGLGVGAVVVAVQLLVFLPLALGAVSLGARMFDLGFGSLGQLLLKLVAITLGTGAFADALLFGLFRMEFEWTYVLVGFLFYMIFCGVPLALMFKTDLQETAGVVSFIAFPRIAAVIGLMAAFPGLFEVR